MLDYLEKQIVLDYHLRGEQEILEKEHPELAEMAKKYLGYELYYELSSQAGGKPLGNDSPGFKEIMKKADELNDKFHKDMQNLEKQSKELTF